MVFQASLVVVQPRELYVEFTGLVNDGERDVPADENRDLVRTGREMRQALQRQARMIRATMPA